MEKTITIDGKDIRFKSTGAVTKRYKMQFQRDFFKDLSKMIVPLAGTDFENEELEAAKIMEQIDFDLFQDLAWVYAKTADPSIPEPLTWLDSFSTFPMMEIIPELQELLMLTIDTKKK